MTVLLGGGGAAALLLLASTAPRPIPVYRPKELAGTPVFLQANRTALTSVGANKKVQHPYKPFAAVLPSGDLLVIAFCPMGSRVGQCSFPNGTAAEHALFWRSSDDGVSWSANAEDRMDMLGREFSLSVLADGTILAPASNLDCNPGCDYPTQLWRSADSGSTWHRANIRIPGVAWDHTNTDRSVIEVDGRALLGVSCRGDSGKPAPCPKNMSLYWVSTDRGLSWAKSGLCSGGRSGVCTEPTDNSTGLMAGPNAACGTVAFPSSAGWDGQDGFFGESTTTVLRSGTILHAGRLGTAYKTTHFDEYDGMWLAASTDSGRSFKFRGCRRGADGSGPQPVQTPHPQCASLAPFGEIGEMYPNILELADGRLLLTFTVRCGVTAVPSVGGNFRCNDTHDGFGLGLRGVLSTDQGLSWAFDNDRLILQTQPFFASPEPSGGGYGNTVQTKDGALVTVGSWRSPDGAIHSEAVRWRLPPFQGPPPPPPSPPCPTPPLPPGRLDSLAVDFENYVGQAARQSAAIQQEIFVNATTPTDDQLRSLQLVRYRGHGCTTPQYYQRLVRIGVTEMVSSAAYSTCAVVIHFPTS